MRVMVECCHDTALARALGVPLRNLGHEHGKGNVLLALAKWRGQAIGIVDADPGKQDSVPREIAKYLPKLTAHGLTLMTHCEDAGKSLVVIAPILEEWLVERAEVSGLRLARYGLPDSARLMHRSPRYDRKPGFRRFLADLSGDQGMATLKKWLGF